MKNLKLIIALGFALNTAHAETTLKFPLLYQDKFGDVMWAESSPEIKPLLKKVGFTEKDMYFWNINLNTVSEMTKKCRSSSMKLENLDKGELVGSQAGLSDFSLDVTSNINGKSITKKLRPCYSGDAKGVTKLLSEMTDGLLSDQFTIHFDAVKKDKNNEDYVLIKYSINDEGDDQSVFFINKCK